jgi:hypothetical protein
MGMFGPILSRADNEEWEMLLISRQIQEDQYQPFSRMDARDDTCIESFQIFRGKSTGYGNATTHY